MALRADLTPAPQGRRLVTRMQAAHRLGCRPDTVVHRAGKYGVGLYGFDPRANRGYIHDAGKVKPGEMVLLEADLPRLAGAFGPVAAATRHPTRGRSAFRSRVCRRSKRRRGRRVSARGRCWSDWTRSRNGKPRSRIAFRCWRSSWTSSSSTTLWIAKTESCEGASIRRASSGPGGRGAGGLACRSGRGARWLRAARRGVAGGGCGASVDIEARAAACVRGTHPAALDGGPRRSREAAPSGCGERERRRVPRGGASRRGRSGRSGPERGGGGDGGARFVAGVRRAVVAAWRGQGRSPGRHRSRMRRAPFGDGAAGAPSRCPGAHRAGARCPGAPAAGAGDLAGLRGAPGGAAPGGRRALA